MGWFQSEATDCGKSSFTYESVLAQDAEDVLTPQTLLVWRDDEGLRGLAAPVSERASERVLA